LWKRHQPCTQTANCQEIYQWRRARYIDAEGQEHIDEAKAKALAASVLPDAAEVQRILALMQHYRAPRGRYDHGGCMDSTRAFARWVCPAPSDLMLPVNGRAATTATGPQPMQALPLKNARQANCKATPSYSALDLPAFQ